MPTVIQDFSGPDIPLGAVLVPTPGTPVQLTFTIDPTGLYAPDKSNISGGKLYPPLRFQQIIFYAYILNPAGGAHGMIKNTGRVYIHRKGGSRDDTGLVVAILEPGATFFLASAPKIGDTFSPYRYWIDSDSANDGVIAVGITQG